jgi:hypothetical protein
MKKKLWFLTLCLIMLLSLFSSCSYSAPFRRLEAVPPDALVVVTLTEATHKAGQKGAFFSDTQAVLATLPQQAGLIGYSYRFEIVGKRAWTMTAWKDLAARDRFASSPTHMAAVRNSRNTCDATRFVTLELPARSVPLRWGEVVKLLSAAPVRE